MPYALDSGPFDKLRVPSLSRDFRQNDKSLRDKERLSSPEGEEFPPSPKETFTYKISLIIEGALKES
jgi:hypothetical protein